MTYPNLKKILQKNNLFRQTVAIASILVNLALISFSPNFNSQAATLPDCKTFTGDPQPGGNCLFYGLPLCDNISGAEYNIPDSSIYFGSDQHRVNCADLSDLPLCSQASLGSNPIKDCVKTCDDPAFDGGVGVRGLNYAVHNRDCVRFCDAPESGITADPGVNCVARACHQLASGVDPSPGTNCELLKCNLLVPNELDELIFDDDTKLYCDNDVKCYEFTSAQLPYIKMRENNRTCQIHNCRVADTCISHSDDDLQKILDKAAIDGSFLNIYQDYAYLGYDINSDLLCNRVDCKPTFYRQYRCSPLDDENPTTPNSECDTALDCPSGYCQKTIDCNLSANDNEVECFQSGTDDFSDLPEDNTESWFYRPQPNSRATLSNGLIRTDMNDNLCYNGKGQLSDNGWGDSIPVLGYFHWGTRSPGMCGSGVCSGRKYGDRGNGYIYVCDTNGSLYNMPSNQSTYFRGYANSHYVEGGGTHKVNICMRFNNTLKPQNSCGARECTIVCAFGCCTQNCGFDVCKELTIEDDEPKQCAMNNSYFTSSKENNCSKLIGRGADSYLRLRAVKYGNYICGFFDLKGTLAYDANYFNGSEQLSDGTCFSGDNVEGNCEGGKNTNDSRGFADVWRTVMAVPYIQNNRPVGSDGPRGFLDKTGRIFQEQECPKVPYRITTPRHYNLANIVNSPNMFTPPIYILNTRVIRGGEISPGSILANLGETDFHYPEIEVRFGTTTQKLSLGIGYTGYEEINADPLGSATITTTIDNFSYEAEVFVRKEQVPNTSPIQPIFCLYRKVQDINGAYIDPLRIACVNRKQAEIDNSDDLVLDPTLALRKVMLKLDASSSFNDPKVSFRYLSSQTNHLANLCSDSGVECSEEVLLENNLGQTSTCYDNIESRRICVQREECSKLNIECTDNEIAIGNAIANNQPIDSLLGTRRNCNEVLLPICNNKKGFSNDEIIAIDNFDYNAAPTDPTIYGWFNEICITSGFETRLKDIIAHQVNNGIKGKCLIDEVNSPYITDGDSDTNCNLGGKAPNCLCVNAVEGVAPPQGFEVRKQTLREAGLCLDIPVPQKCNAISYNKSPNPDVSDYDYILSSINNNSYGVNESDIDDKVHISHKYRSEGKPAPNAIELKGHAKFPTSIFGVDNVIGECRGFWTYQKSTVGNILYPKLNCINNNGAAIWEDDARDACVRYECPLIQTLDPDENGNYQGNYGVLESGENKGLSNGFALWDSYQKTNDFLENTTATSCITGFKKAGATALTTSGLVTGQNAITASLYNLITGYSGGSLPTRACNQVGQWQAVQNACERITCPIIDPPTPTGPDDSSAWDLWSNSGGATFPTTNASRVANNSQIPAESIAVGTCDESLGFFKTPGGENPTKKCDHLGNWLETENVCTTKCDAITDDTTGSSYNNGYSKWSVPSSSKKIRIYEDCSYGGWVSEYEIGDYLSLPSQYNDASSIVVDPGLKVTLYNGSNYTGDSVVLTANLSCFLQYPNLNDQVRSMKVELNGPETLLAEFNGCVTGYIQNPYPPFQDVYGNDLASEIANDLTRQAEPPLRVCFIQDSGDGYFTSQWGAVVNGCINQCPGYDVDSRIGVGITTHATSGGDVNLQWPSTDLGEDVYLSNFTGSSNFDASYFTLDDANQYYLVKRHCNLDGSWSDPEPMCAANSGQIGAAYYDKGSSISGNEDSIPVSLASNLLETITGSCISNYWYNNFNQDGPPIRACLYKDENLRQIDQTYLALVNSSSDCEQKRCPALSNYVGTKSSFPDVAFDDNRTIQGQIVQGSCLNNQTNSDSELVYSSLESGTTNPYIRCETNGVWSTINSENNCKQSCTFPYNSQALQAGETSTKTYSYNTFSMAHDEELIFNVMWGEGHFVAVVGHRYYCATWSQYLRCDDGNAITAKANPIHGRSGSDLCHILNYDYNIQDFPSTYDDDDTLHRVNDKAVFKNGKRTYKNKYNQDETLNINNALYYGSF